ncbi:tryptophan-rich sensory protein [Candidatus Woesearchaeota archaeon]|nr:tryptophan-rich sensory protein [Candidatus Woesearchaeota archaeon]
MKDFIRLIISIIICQLAGFLGGLFNIASIPTWYAALKKPVFNPPNWVFAPVWTFLFLLMGISLYLVWKKGFGNDKLALYFFIIQFLLNILWSALFFGLRMPLAAFVEIILLWIAILATIITFYKISSAAGIMLIPYLLWVSFAAVLNFSIWMINQ